MPSGWQQPVHTVLSQTHAPLTQCWPGLHAAEALPQMQVPVATAQRSDSGVRQSVHAAPMAPHDESACGSHAPPLQQPAAHDVALQPVPQGPPSQPHAPPLHVWPTGHAAHCAPLLPQAKSAPPSRHVLPLQQPPHEVTSQRQLP